MSMIERASLCIGYGAPILDWDYINSLQATQENQLTLFDVKEYDNYGFGGVRISYAPPYSF